MNEQAGTTDRVLQRRDAGGVAWLMLNRPAARNALSIGLMQALVAEFIGIEHDPDVKVVVISGAGPAFCAGHDLRELRATPERETYETTFTLCSTLMTSIVRLPKPVIARVHGVATAAGCQLVATCDLAVAADSARFATPGVNIGLFCSTPMVALSRAVGRKAAMEMLLTGELIDAQRAHALGLINRVVPEAELDVAVASLASTIAWKSVCRGTLWPLIFTWKSGVSVLPSTTILSRVPWYRPSEERIPAMPLMVPRSASWKE